MSGLAQLFVFSFIIFAIILFYAILKEKIKKEIKDKYVSELKDEGISYIEELDDAIEGFLNCKDEEKQNYLKRIKINLASLRHFIEELDD